MLEAYTVIATVIRDKLKSIAWIDIDKGQLDSPDNYDSIIVPGVLIGLPETSWELLGDKNEMGVGTMTVKLVLRLPAQTHDTDPLFGSNIEAVGLADALHAVLSDRTIVKGITSRISTRAYPVLTFFVIETTYAVTHNFSGREYAEKTVALHVTPKINRP